jgi:hypothetical protein
MAVPFPPEAPQPVRGNGRCGASSPIPRIVTHRLQSADFRHSRAANGNRIGDGSGPSRTAALAHPTTYSLEDLGFAARQGAPLHRRAQHRAAAASCRSTPMAAAFPMDSGMYGMYALQESVRQMRGTAPRRSPAPRSRSAMVWAACSPPSAPSSCPMRRHDGGRMGSPTLQMSIFSIANFSLDIQ